MQHIDVESLAAIATIVLAAAGGLSALFGHWLARRQASGRVATSEAAEIWAQSQDMRHMMQERLIITENQRDRLIESYNQQVLPMLTSISQLVGELSGPVTDGLVMIRELSAEVREVTRRDLAQSPAEPPSA